MTWLIQTNEHCHENIIEGAIGHRRCFLFVTVTSRDYLNLTEAFETAAKLFGRFLIMQTNWPERHLKTPQSDEAGA